MSLEELKKFREKMEAEQKWAPIVRVNDKMNEDDDPYIVGLSLEKKEYVSKDDTDLFVTAIEDALKEQMRLMIGTPYDYTLDLSFDFGLVCKEKFADSYAEFSRNKNTQIVTYANSILEHSIPKKVAIKLGNLLTKCYYDKIEIAEANERVYYPSFRIYVVDFDHMMSRLAELGYELRINSPSLGKDYSFHMFETIPSAFRNLSANPEGIHICVDFSDKKEVDNSPKTYTKKPSKKKKTKKESE
jgi:hypothetical protein